nr:hypothetical protein [uncultured Actinoplanes sp.]
MADIISFGPDRPPRRPPRLIRAIVAAVVLLAAGVALVVSARGRDDRPEVAVTPSCRPVGPPPSGTGPPVAVIVEGACAPGSALERRDNRSAGSPWTVVVRRTDGSPARHGAVVTFPVGPPVAGRHVAVGEVTGTASPGMIVWPLAGAYARIRGDLAERDLIATAVRTTVAGRRPAVRPPAGYRVVSAGPYRPPETREIRYGTADLGEQDALGGGLTFTGVTAAGGFEDRLYATRTDDEYRTVDGKPAVVTMLFGGNGAIAWELTPGTIAYVGYSGASLTGRAVDALDRLAHRTRVLTAPQWQARTPQIVG